MEEHKNDKDGFCINVYSSGNFIAREITFTGIVNIGGGHADTNGYTDEQIVQAIKAVNGEKKPLNSKRKWAAVYWCLKWYCNYPTNVPAFCDKVKELPLGKLEYECDYNNIRRECSLTFMDQDARCMDKVKPSKDDQNFFLQCREVVLALVTELGKAALPKVDLM